MWQSWSLTDSMHRAVPCGTCMAGVVGQLSVQVLTEDAIIGSPPLIGMSNGASAMQVLSQSFY